MNTPLPSDADAICGPAVNVLAWSFIANEPVSIAPGVAIHDNVPVAFDSNI